jgi:MFS family permease
VAPAETHWDVPYPYGDAAAIDSMGAVAAPLLAGFSVTLAALVLSAPSHFRWVSVTLVLLVIAALALIMALQFAFRARQFVVSPAEIEQWWPDAASPERRQMLRREQREHRAEYTTWSNSARHAYNTGILFFVAGLTSALVRPGPISNGRLTAIALALLGVVGEFCWIANDATAKRRAKLANK